MGARKAIVAAAVVVAAAGAAAFGGVFSGGGTDLCGGGPVRPEATEPALAIAPFVQKGIDWLAKAQHTDGGWGAGSSSRQDVRDAHAVQTDPATTAFVGLALVRAGHTPTSGAYRENVVSAVKYLAKVVEDAGDGPKITELQSTQPQAKMGPLVDTALTVQFLSRVVPLIPAKDPLHARADAALDKALAKLGKTQTADGRWGEGGWANTLQTSLGTVAYEMAQSAGKSVPQDRLELAREVQKSQMDASGSAAGGGGSAGVELYAWAGAGRAGAQQAEQATRAMREAKADGDIPMDAPATRENLVKAGIEETEVVAVVKAIEVARSQVDRLDDEKLLQGFGNNGGEEFLSYMHTSESLVIQGGDEWPRWHDKMHGLLEKVQSADGSWTGHHCITSPVFCTAAAVQVLTADRDAAFLRAQQKPAAKPGADASR